MSVPLKKSPYSQPFNVLVLYGAWTFETDRKILRRAYVLHQCIMFSVAMALIYYFIRDLFNSLGDIKKTSWNICVSALFYGSVLKLLLLYRKKDIINSLRLSMHKDWESRKDSEDKFVRQSSLSLLKKTRMHLFGSAICFGSVWLVSRYLSKYSDTKLLPIPLEVPFEVDLTIGENFDAVFFSFSMIGSSGIFFILQQEYGMFSILLQLTREWSCLLNDIPKLDEVFTNEWVSDDPNARYPWLQKEKAKDLIRQFCIRHQIVIRYTNDYEYCYNRTMLLQVLIIIILAVAIAFQCFMLSMEYLPELSYQIGYLIIVISDMFLLCYIATLLNSQCRALGLKLYEREWYLMDSELKKDIALMILMSQRPPRITTIKAVDLDLQTFKSIMQHIYSLLALFRQVTLKTTQIL